MIRNLQPVCAVQDDACHWYTIPTSLRDEFYTELNAFINDDEYNYEEWEAKFSKYRTGGDPNRIQLYAVLKDEVVPTYKRTEFDGYTHRFIIEFEIGGDSFSHKLTLYSDSDDYQLLEKFIQKNKTCQGCTFKIVHRASKEQDDIATKFIEETLKDI